MDIFGTGFNLLLIVLGFGLLIFVHELGHFLAAKWAGIRTEAFAVGMGPVITSWRKGIGFVAGSTHQKVVELTGKPAAELNDEDLEKHGLGETEYSLRWLPIGGFVKMLGQEDINPSAVSNDPRSYNVCPIGKRMIVVSAGVVMNLILAAILFVAAFMVGVKFESPVVGEVSTTLAAGTTRPLNGDLLGVTDVGVQPGDLVVTIDDDAAETFADLQIASAMSKPGTPIRMTVERAGVPEPLEFELMPKKDPYSGLLSIGVSPASSTTLWKDRDTQIDVLLERIGLAEAGVYGGMRLMTVGGHDVATFEQFQRKVEVSDGQPLVTQWATVDGDGQAGGTLVDAALPVDPVFHPLIYPRRLQDTTQNSELGLLGMVPLVKITDPGRRNGDVLHSGDVVLRAGGLDAPKMAEFQQQVRKNAGKTLDMIVLRDGNELEVQASVDRKGALGVGITYAFDLPMIARPFEEVRRSLAEGEEPVATPVAPLQLTGRTRVLEIAGTPITDWADIRAALRAATADARARDAGAEIEMLIAEPTPEHEEAEVALVLTPGDVETLHGLGWQTSLASYAFEPIYVTRSAGGNPVRAIVMGVEETHKLILMTYLTIDRLIRGSVGVEQLRGPVGIVHLGTKIADRGMRYLIFLLAVISVNLAVINFLPLPIVDGGLFLFLVYEKLKGRPPPVAFQNAAFIAGLFLIGTAFVVTFYNDVARLIG